jgi:hypothetical protein
MGFDGLPKLEKVLEICMFLPKVFELMSVRSVPKNAEMSWLRHFLRAFSLPFYRNIIPNGTFKPILQSKKCR